MSLLPQAPPFSIGESSGLEWWLEPRQQHAYPDLSRLAIDIFSIPPMSAEAERVFSGTRRTISWERASLSAHTIERLECLKNWLKSKLSHGVFLTKESKIIRAYDSELMIKQVERENTES